MIFFEYFVKNHFPFHVILHNRTGVVYWEWEVGNVRFLLTRSAYKLACTLGRSN